MNSLPATPTKIKKYHKGQLCNKICRLNNRISDNFPIYCYYSI